MTEGKFSNPEAIQLNLSEDSDKEVKDLKPEEKTSDVLDVVEKQENKKEIILTPKQEEKLDNLRSHLEIGAKNGSINNITFKLIKELPVEILNSYPDIKENITTIIIRFFNSCAPDISELFAKCGLAKPEDYKDLLVKKIAEKVKGELWHAGKTVETSDNLVEYFNNIKNIYSINNDDLVKNKEIQNKIIEFMKKEVDDDFPQSVLDIKNKFHLQTETLSEIDSITVEKATLGNNLIKFIKYLGDDELAKLLPMTFSAAREAIFAKLDTDEDLADYFMENLPKYYQQPWAGENVAKAVKIYSVADKFVSAIDFAKSGSKSGEQEVWINESWVSGVFSKAKAVIEEHNKQQLQEDGELSGNKGFSESDPYENHPWRAGKEILFAEKIKKNFPARI